MSSYGETFTSGDIIGIELNIEQYFIIFSKYIHKIVPLTF